MRLPLAIVVAGVALAGAAYLGSLHLGGATQVSIQTTSRGYDNPSGYGESQPELYILQHDRADWQIPVAIIIATLGIGTALVVARSPNRGA